MATLHMVAERVNMDLLPMNIVIRIIQELISNCRILGETSTKALKRLTDMCDSEIRAALTANIVIKRLNSLLRFKLVVSFTKINYKYY